MGETELYRKKWIFFIKKSEAIFLVMNNPSRNELYITYHF